MGDVTCLHTDEKIFIERRKLILRRDAGILRAMSLSRGEGMRVHK